jgi:hypothetical protein
LLSSHSRDRMLTEYWEGFGIPSWASLTTRARQYTEYYDTGGERAFREYYALDTDPWQLLNVLHDGIRANNPDVSGLEAQLAADRECSGTTGPSACP